MTLAYEKKAAGARSARKYAATAQAERAAIVRYVRDHANGMLANARDFGTAKQYASAAQYLSASLALEQLATLISDGDHAGRAAR